MNVKIKNCICNISSKTCSDNVLEVFSVIIMKFKTTLVKLRFLLCKQLFICLRLQFDSASVAQFKFVLNVKIMLS